MPISEKSYYVRGIANGIPARIVSRVEIAQGGIGSSAVTPPYIDADGFSRYFITYTLYDGYGNPVSDRIVNFSTTIPGEQLYLPATTDLGEVKIFYGPKDQVGTVTLNAVSVDNPNAYVNNTVKFINSTATDMLLTANPETMASRDSPDHEEFRANVIAKVVDENGNGVPGQSVSFVMNGVSYAGTYAITNPPVLETSSAITDSDGYAYALFRPGAFTTNPQVEHWEPSATGRCNITATWNNTPHTIMLTWKNYPYLSAETSVSPNVVNVTDDVTVTLRLKGDGWALQPKPIDVLLLLDNSGSMGATTDSNSGLSQSKRSAINFINKMTQDKDRVGVIFYDKKTDPDFSVYVPLTYNLSSVKSAITNYKRTDGGGYHTRTRYALYTGIKKMNDWNTRSSAIRVIIHMTDGQWSMEGDPLARAGSKGFNQSFTPYENQAGGLHSVWAGNVVGVTDKYRYFDDLGGGVLNTGNASNFFPNGQSYDSGTTWVNDQHETEQNYISNPSSNLPYFTNAENSNQNMSYFANASRIRVYSIAFTEASQNTKVTYVLTTMSDATGGFYRYAKNEADLNTFYEEIAGTLKEEAGVNTLADLNYGTVNVNQVPDSNVFSYVYSSPVSTMNRTYYAKNGTTIRGPYSYNQSQDWNDKILSFNVGTIKVNQVWETTYKLKVLKPGNIDVFGIGSQISFNNHASTMLLPKTLITALPNMDTTGGVNFTKTLTIHNLTATVNENNNLADLSVDIQILPSSPNLSVIADIYITDEDQHTTTWIKSVELAPVINGKMHITSIDLSQYQRGKQYTFYVDFVNKQPGTNPVYWAQLSSNNFVMMRKPAGVYIRLE
jgi:hypothetical protein